MKTKLHLLILIVVTSIYSAISFGGTLENVTPEKASMMREANKALIVDVREASEVANGKVKDAIVIPMSEMNNNKAQFEKDVKKLSKDKMIIVYCHTGRRAGIVGSELEKMGYKVFNMGGFDGWKSKGLPTDK